MRYECHLHQSSGETCIKATKNILFNTGCYWELFSGITPIKPHCMANDQNRIYNICYWCCFCLFALRLLYNSIYSIFKFVCIQNLRCLSFRSIWVYSRGFQFGSCCSIFSFLCNVLFIIVYHFVIFIVVIVLIVLRRFASSNFSSF